MFASLFEVTMLDPSVGTRPLTFELSIGKQCILCAGHDSCCPTNTSALELRPTTKTIIFIRDYSAEFFLNKYISIKSDNRDPHNFPEPKVISSSDKSMVQNVKMFTIP